MLSGDEQLLARLQAPPDLSDGVQALEYWRQRRRQLPFYRMRARREAARMTVRWEQRVRGGVFTQSGTPIATRFSAGLLIARMGMRRRARFALVTVAAIVTLVAAPFFALGVVLLLQVL